MNMSEVHPATQLRNIVVMSLDSFDPGEDELDKFTYGDGSVTYTRDRYQQAITVSVVDSGKNLTLEAAIHDPTECFFGKVTEVEDGILTETLIDDEASDAFAAYVLDCISKRLKS